MRHPPPLPRQAALVLPFRRASDSPVRLFRFLRGNKRSLDSNFHNLKICRRVVACGQPSPCPSAAQHSPPSCRSRADVREGSSCPPTATRVSPLKARTWNRRSPPCGRLDAARSSKRRPAAAFDPPPFERQQRGRQRVAAKILNKAVGPGNAQTQTFGSRLDGSLAISLRFREGTYDGGPACRLRPVFIRC